MNWKLDPQLLAVFQESCDAFSKLEQAALVTQRRTSRVIRLMRGSFNSFAHFILIVTELVTKEHSCFSKETVNQRLENAFSQLPLLCLNSMPYS